MACTMQFYGLYRATVTDLDDPQGKNRIQVLIPAVSSSPHWASACLPCVVASAILDEPAVGSTVWVAFEAGDAGRPVYLGMLPS